MTRSIVQFGASYPGGSGQTILPTLAAALSSVKWCQHCLLTLNPHHQTEITLVKVMPTL